MSSFQLIVWSGIIGGVLWWISRRVGLTPLWPVFLRFGLMLGILWLALNWPAAEYRQPTNELRVLILDFSDSISDTRQTDLLMLARSWKESNSGGVLIAFGSEALLMGDASFPMDGRGSDLLGALHLAQRMAGEKDLAIWLISDGLVDKPLEVGEWLLNTKLQLTVIPISDQQNSNDLFLGEINAPGGVWAGSEYIVSIPLYSPGEGNVAIQISVDGINTSTEVSVVEGWQSFDYSGIAPQSGMIAMRVYADWAGDQQPINNQGFAAMQVFTAPKVAFVTEENAFASGLQRALIEQGLIVNILSPDQLPTRSADLKEYNVIVVNNLLAESLSFEQMLGLENFVSQLGGGVVFLGGRNSYSLGGYEGTPLEAILPVALQAPPRSERPPITFLMILDRSGSMRDRDAIVDPIVLAQEAALRAIDALRADDLVGIVTYSDEPVWTVPIRPLGSGASLRLVQDAISQITANGGTRIYQALVTGLQGIAAISGSQGKHLLLLSDGVSSDGSLAEFTALAQAASDADITISTIALGVESDVNILSAIAEAGGGRFYAVIDPQDLPGVLISESKAARSENIQFGQTSLIAGETHHALYGAFDPNSLPPVQAYNAITSRKADGAEDILVSSNFQDPLLSAWQVGLGRVIAWMGDIGEDFAPAWGGFPRRGEFWQQIIQYALPIPSLEPANVEFSIEKDMLQLRLRITSGVDVPVNFASPDFSFVGLDGTIYSYPFEQYAPGEYSLEVPAPEYGAYRGVVGYLTDDGYKELAVPFAVNIPDEWRVTDPNSGKPNLQNWAALTGGELISLDEFAATSPVVSETIRIDPFLVSLVIILSYWMIEIAVRRRWLPWHT